MLPLIPLVVAGVMALAGTGAGVDAVVKNKRTKDNNNRAQEIVDEARSAAEKEREQTKKELQGFGKKKLEVMDVSIGAFAQTFGKLKNVEVVDLDHQMDSKRLKMNYESLSEWEKMSATAKSVLGGLTGGIGTGALIAFGAYKATTAFAAASTGTLIHTLSGVAASNATLAFLGGGSLAAGGMGVAGGSAVLGGAIAGPAIFVMGIALNVTARKNYHKSYSNLAEAEQAAEGMNTVKVLCSGITRRTQQMKSLLCDLDDILKERVSALEDVIARSGTDYAAYTREERDVAATACAVAQAVKQVIDTPVLNEDGTLTDASKKTVDELRSSYPEKKPQVEKKVWDEEAAKNSKFCDAFAASAYYFALCDGSIAPEEEILLAQYVDSYLSDNSYSEECLSFIDKVKKNNAIPFSELTPFLDKISAEDLGSIRSFIYKIIYASEGKNAQESIAYTQWNRYQDKRSMAGF